MKTFITLFLSLLFSTLGIAQNGINYKALIKDSNGNVVANSIVVVEFSILQGAAQTVVYKEKHSPATDANGLIIVNIGEGTPVTGTFATIDWASDSTFLNTKINTGAGLVDMGTTEFKTVPYALHAKSVSGAITKINDLLDGKSDANGSSLFIGLDSGASDDGSDNQNTAIGNQALYSNTTGSNNTANGYESLRSNTTGFYNTAIGFNALFANTTGQSNTATGARSLHSNTTGLGNTTSGFESLFSNISGWYNTANGSYSLWSNTTGESNSAYGTYSLYSNTTGMRNAANGSSALRSNITGNYNTANGYQALYNNTTGEYNTATGSESLYTNTIGFYNTANGNEALKSNTTGNRNTANGFRSLYSNTTGENNVANGFSSLLSNTTGLGNVANGSFALSRVTTGNFNIGIGYNAQVPNNAGSNQLRIGNTAISYAGVQVSWSVTSDKRWKNQIRALPYGLNMVTQLQAVDYVRKNNENQTREIGFIAQDVKALLETLGYTDQGILSTDDDGFMSLRYNDFIPVLVKAIQEQQELIKSLQSTVDSQQSSLNTQDLKIDTLTAELDQLKRLDYRVEQLEILLKASHQ